MEVLTRVDGERISALRGRDEFFWLDLVAPGDAEMARLGELLGLHPLAVEDSREWGQRPKLDSYGDHLLLVFFTAQLDEIHIYISGGFVLTVRRGESAVLDDCHASLEPEDPEDEERLVYFILDGLTDDYVPVLDALEEAIDRLEESILDRVRREQLGEIYRFKQDVQHRQRLIIAQRDALQETVEAVSALPGLVTGSGPYLRDVVDHTEQVRSELNRHAADLANLLDTFFNANANRLNRMTGVLTVVATLFFVWTLVTSFFGQNFGWLVRSIDTKADFLVFGVGGLVLPALALGALAYWRRDDWL